MGRTVILELEVICGCSSDSARWMSILYCHRELITLTAVPNQVDESSMSSDAQSMILHARTATDIAQDQNLYSDTTLITSAGNVKISAI